MLPQQDAADMLLDFFENARKVKESLRAAMDEYPEVPLDLTTSKLQQNAIYLTSLARQNLYPELFRNQANAS